MTDIDTKGRIIMASSLAKTAGATSRERGVDVADVEKPPVPRVMNDSTTQKNVRRCSTTGRDDTRGTTGVFAPDDHVEFETPGVDDTDFGNVDVAIGNVKNRNDKSGIAYCTSSSFNSSPEADADAPNDGYTKRPKPGPFAACQDENGEDKTPRTQRTRIGLSKTGHKEIQKQLFALAPPLEPTTLTSSMAENSKEQDQRERLSIRDTTNVAEAQTLNSGNRQMQQECLSGLSRDIETGTDQNGDERMTTPSTNPAIDASVEVPIPAYTIGAAATIPTTELVDAKPYVDPTQQYTRWAWVGVAVLIAAIVGIPSGVTLRRRNQRQGAAATEAPSLAPTVEPIPPDPIQVLEPIFGNISAMEDTTFEKLAFDWLTMNDANGLLSNWRTQEWQILQRYGVAYLYFATEGSGWTEQLNFLADANECEWNQTVKIWYAEDEGLSLDDRENTTKAGIVTCDQEGRITGLVLPNNGLGNWVPYKAIIDTLPKLQTLDIMNPYIDPYTGLFTFNSSEPMEFPSEIGRLTDLQTLSLPGNMFNGTIPYGIWNNLSNLKFLAMHVNSIEGTLSTELGDLTQLQSLIFRDNLLTGPIPSELGRLNSLRRFTLSANQLTGRLPPPLGAWGSRIEYVTIEQNQLTGCMPESYANWTNIEKFYCWDNMLTGTLPASYGAWGASIERVYLDDNQITGSLPESYGNWTNIAQVYFFDNILNGTLPSSYGAWGASMEYVGLTRNQFTGPLPESYANWTSIVQVNLYGNLLTGTLPSSYGAWGASVEYADLGQNILTGPLPVSYANWTNIVDVYFENNRLTGMLPSSYGDWGGHLRSAWFHNNLLASTLPSSYGSWTQVESVNFASNCLDDEIPAEYETQWMNYDAMISEDGELIFGLQSNLTEDGKCV
jgi:Leucine-rich repeat (LRR) protein